MRSCRPIQISSVPLSEEQRQQRSVVVLGMLAALAGRFAEAIVAHLLVLEGGSLMRRATVGLPREAMLRVLLVSLRRIAASLDAMVAEARAGLAQAGAQADEHEAADACPAETSAGGSAAAARLVGAVEKCGIGPVKAAVSPGVQASDVAVGWAPELCGVDMRLGERWSAVCLARPPPRAGANGVGRRAHLHAHIVTVP